MKEVRKMIRGIFVKNASVNVKVSESLRECVSESKKAIKKFCLVKINHI